MTKRILACVLLLFATDVRADFIVNNTPLPPTKTNLTPLPPGADPTKFFQASDYNALMNALLDTRNAIVDGNLFGMNCVASRPTQPVSGKFFWCSSAFSPPHIMFYDGTTDNDLSNGGAVASVSNSDGSLAVSPTTGAVVASLDTTHANTWTASQTFQNILLRTDNTYSVGSVSSRATNIYAFNLLAGNDAPTATPGIAMSVLAQNGGIDGGVGAAAGANLTLSAGNGGASNLFGQTGTGGTTTITSGNGGTHSAGGTARNGGQLFVSAGHGGTATNGSPGNASGVLIYGGTGGVNSSNTTGGPSGNGGSVQLIGGDGGDGGGGPIIGGNGGDAIVDAGNGGANGGVSGTVKLATNTGVDTRVGGDLRVYNTGTIYGIPQVGVDSHILLDAQTARLIAQNATVNASNASGTLVTYFPWTVGVEFISDGIDFFNASLGLNIMKFDNTGSISTFVLTPAQTGANNVQLGLEGTPFAALYSSRLTSPAPGTPPTCTNATHGGTSSSCNCVGNDSVGRCFITITADGVGPDLLDVTFNTPYETAPFAAFFADTGIAPTHTILQNAYFTSTTLKATLNSTVTWGANTTFDFWYLFIGR